MHEQKKNVPDAKQSLAPEHADLQTAFVLADLDRASQQQTAPQQQRQQPVKLPETLALNLLPMGSSAMYAAQMQLASFAVLPQQQQQNILAAAVRASIQTCQFQQQQSNSFTPQNLPGVSCTQDTAASALLSTAAGGHAQQASQYYEAAMHWLSPGTGSESNGVQVEGTASGGASATSATAAGASKSTIGALGAGKAKSAQRGRKGGVKGGPKPGMLTKKRNSISMDICESASGGSGAKSKQPKKTKAVSSGHLLATQSKKSSKSEKPPTSEHQNQTQQPELNQQLQNMQQQQHSNAPQQQHISSTSKQHSTTNSSTPVAMEDSDDDQITGPNGQPMSRRERKNTREKQRRLEVNTMFDNLMGILELPKDAKADKVKILQNAIDSIATLREETHYLREEAHYFRSLAPPAAVATFAAYTNSSDGGTGVRHDVVVPRSDSNSRGGGKMMHGGVHVQTDVGVIPSVGRVLDNNTGHGEGGVNKGSAGAAVSSVNGALRQPSGRRLSVLSSASYSSMDESKSNSGGSATPVDKTVGGTYTA